MTDIAFQGAVIFVQDLAASRRFYEELLGQQVDLDFGVNVGFKCGLALWQVDHACAMVYGHPPEPAGRLGRGNFELCFETADLETVADRLREEGVAFVQPLREQPWGQRVLHVHDPDGHVVELGEPMDAVIARLLAIGMSVQAVAERTGMPPALVAQIAHSTEQPLQGGGLDDASR